MPSFLQPDLQQILSQAISFLILLAIMRRFAWRPLLGMLDARRARIEEDLRKAAQAQAGIAKLETQLNERLAKIDEEARTKIQQAVLEAKRITLEMQEEARTQARAVLAKSKETVEMELAQARVTLRDQVAEMTLATVERILGQKLDAEADRRLVEGLLGELEQRPAHR